MSVKLRGNKWHYRFMLAGGDYSGLCENCSSEAEARAFEKNQRKTVGNIKTQKTVRALIDNHRYELSGGEPVPLKEGYDLMLKKPVRKKPSVKVELQKRNYWNDFLSYICAHHPDVLNMGDVKKAHCESYVKYLQDNGRFNKVVITKVNRGTSCRRKLKDAEYTRDFKISTRTIVAIRSTCAEVFTKLSEDAGILYNPWHGVVLPTQQSESREIFSDEEIALIKDGIQHDEFCKPLFIIAAATGLTEGDICTLRWDEILFAENVIRHKRRKTGVPLEIPMINGLAAYLQGLKRISEYVLPEHDSQYKKGPTSISYRITRFLQGLGIKTTKEIEGRRAISVKDLHSMRHLFCYHAGMAGIPLSTVQSIVGHLTPEMTKHYQAHATRKAKSLAVEMLPALLSLNSAELDSSASLRKRLADLAYTLPIEKVEECLRIYSD